MLGGTFDPIHDGHLVAAREVMTSLALDQVLFVPTGDSWQKNSETPALDRCAMVLLAIKGEPKFSLSLIDVDRAGPTYTVDTLRELRSIHETDELFFILGTDAMAGIESWKDYQELWELATFVVVTRPGFDVKLPADDAENIVVLSISALDIASTEVRKQIRSGLGLKSDLVPKAVADYIRAHKLYGVND